METAKNMSCNICNEKNPCPDCITTISNQKITISGADLTNWMSTTYTQYASQTVNEEQLILSVNHHGVYKVTHGEKLLYRGPDRYWAIAAWDAA